MKIITPYPGLRPFEHHEDILFFGRDEQVDQLLDKLADTHFLAVLGTSGSGKSSLVKAGLLPALNSGYMAGTGARWDVAELRPGDSPFQRLASSLVRDTDWGKAYRKDRWKESTATDRDGGINEVVAALESDLRQGDLALNWRLGVHPLASGTRLLILVDQFEELFRYHRTAEADAAAFTALLLGAATHSDVYVVITMRSEFLGDCSLYPDLPEAINAGLFLTPSLAPEEMADAIELPARLAHFNGEVDSELVRHLVAEAKGRNDQLPLLQHVLMRLWNRFGENKHLTFADLNRLGGLEGCLNAHVEEAYGDLNEQQKRWAEIMFRSLTERSDEKRDTRRPALLGEIAQLADTSIEELATVVEIFRQPGHSFLMPPTGIELTAETVLDITHEALIRQWKRLQQWTENEAEQAELYLRLESSAQRHQEGKGARWIDPDLEHALQWRKDSTPTQAWADRYGGDFDLAMSFLDASLKDRDDKREVEKRRQQKEIKRARWIAAASLMALIITIALAGWALFERNHAIQAEKEAEHHANMAEQRELQAKQAEQVHTESLFDSSLTHASLLAQVNDPAEAHKILRQTVQLDPSITESRRHTRNLLAGYVDIMGGTADKIYAGADAALVDMAVSPDGQLLAAAGERGTLVLFDAESGKLLKRLQGHDASAGIVGGVATAVFTSRGDALYSGGEDRRIIRWSMPDGEKQAEWKAPDGVWSLALSPDGTTLAGAKSSDGITLWETSTGQQIQTLSGKTSLVSHGNSLAFSSDGQWLVSGGFRGEVGIWDVVSGKEQVLPRLHTEEINAVAVSPDGQWIASGSADKRIILWNTKSRHPLRMLRGHENMIIGLTFSQDSRRLFSASRDNTLRLWDVATGVLLRTYQGHTAGLWSVVRYGKNLYTAASDSTVRRWSADTPGQWVWDLEGEPISTSISPDGTFISIGFRDGLLQIYSLQQIKNLSPELILSASKPFAEIKHAHETYIIRQAFNKSGTLLATASLDNKAKLWRIERKAGGMTLTLRHTLIGHADAVHDVVFSPNGQTLATASYDGKVGLFDVETGKVRFFDSATVGQVVAVEFSNDGKQVMTVNKDDQIIRFWNVDSDLTAPTLELPKMMDSPMWATLRLDGLQLTAVGREASRITLYNLGPDAVPPRKLVGHEQTVYRAIYSPDGTQLATVSSDMTVRLWNLATGKALFTLPLPTEYRRPSPLWDFDFRCVPDGHCWIAVPLTMGRLVLYRLPYAEAPASLKHLPKIRKAAPH